MEAHLGMSSLKWIPGTEVGIEPKGPLVEVPGLS